MSCMSMRPVSLALGFALTLTAALAAPLHAQQATVPLWPHATPEPAQTADPEKDVTTDKDPLISGHRSARITNVTKPMMYVYQPPPHIKNTGAAALVFPGGGYFRLAWDGEGTDTCQWLNSIGMTCLLVKYRVPEVAHYPTNYAPLEDAQQAMRLARAHAKEWHLDPKKIGVVGFSAGANLAALMSTHPDDNHVASTPAAPDADTKIDARANFAIVVYPAYLIVPPATKDTPDPFPKLDPVYTPNEFTPPTFLIQAENDRGYGKNAPVYYQALAAANIPVELHMYATGGHGFGLHPIDRPEEHWTQLAAAWLRGIDIIPALSAVRAPDAATSSFPVTAPAPCPNPASQPPAPGRPTTATPTDPACW
jgi:acetyl esterase/lipase